MRRLPLRTAMAGLAVIGCMVLGFGWTRVAARHEAPPLPDYGAVPAFSLTDQQGRPFTRAQLEGAVWVADFIFTRCAGQCPLMTAQLGRIQEALHAASGWRLVSFSVDPEHDTPEVLAAYAKEHGADPLRWTFATGSPAAITELAQGGFRLGVSEAEEGAAREPITHSVRLVLVDAQGRLRGYYDATDPQAMRKLTDNLRRLLRDGASS